MREAKPKVTAECHAAWLREEILAVDAHLSNIEERRGQAAASGEVPHDLIAMLASEKERASVCRSELRSCLQHLTGELWS